jgi:3'-phosphoadenosine 5'-phosphosulfate sulfotransferase (PAPS reductase)/FAD synthetase
VDISNYDFYIVAFSGGKDSTACVLDLLDRGIPKDKIELWHHIVDGREGSDLMDWPVTEDYCKKFAEAFGLKIFFSWKTGGFEKEMLRENTKTAPNKFEFKNDDNIIECGLTGGVRGKENTRRMFPQVSANLSTRWCSAYLKIDVCTAAINNQKRFLNKRTLVITGERAQESKARSNYKEFEPDRSHCDGKRIKRHVDHLRPVHKWDEFKVWGIIKRYRVAVHPAYYLGWGRLSCMACIFGSKNQWASIKKIAPNKINKIYAYEREFNHTINRKKNVMEIAAEGTPYPNMHPFDVKTGMSKTYNCKIFIDNWELPAGAYGENAGPS